MSYSIYSAFSFYGTRRGGELPGPWLVAACGVLGHQRAAVRQTLYRMERSQELASTPAGRVKRYRLTPAALAEAQAGLAKIMDVADEPWDGQWTLVHLHAPADDRIERERLRAVLRAEGFAAAGGGLYVHPRDRSVRVLAAARGHGAAETLEVFRARRKGDVNDRAFVATHWNVDALARSYRQFIQRFGPLARSRTHVSSQTAFVLRFAVVFDYLETAWRDPELAAELLPAAWPGHTARRLSRLIYRRFLPAALKFGDTLMDRVHRHRGPSPAALA